eukprot:CAMPEP_0182422984 /NCGR_PEP_ID=MMETSP1167-20130531/8864_1 /TAXON_ID=2988 /ORGANISM="Mallomonas Sp, Strain CCMP3275" /LENGTH=440 /DNA_ID=CAMNT_0024601537 /DNA_START=125 /DNA_END=1444 /DNA_ORIENTATION=+
MQEVSARLPHAFSSSRSVREASRGKQSSSTREQSNYTTPTPSPMNSPKLKSATYLHSSSLALHKKISAKIVPGSSSPAFIRKESSNSGTGSTTGGYYLKRQLSAAMILSQPLSDGSGSLPFSTSSRVLRRSTSKNSLDSNPGSPGAMVGVREDLPVQHEFHLRPACSNTVGYEGFDNLAASSFARSKAKAVASPPPDIPGSSLNSTGTSPENYEETPHLVNSMDTVSDNKENENISPKLGHVSLSLRQAVLSSSSSVEPVSARSDRSLALSARSDRSLARSSILGQGSDMFPRRHVEDSVPPTSEMSLLQQKEKGSVFRVLIADDSRVNRRMMHRLLEGLCDAICEAEDGVQAVSSVQESLAAGCPFHLVFMDNHMPNMDGPSAVKLIRSHDKEVMIIGLSGDSDPECISSFMDNGTDSIVLKPIRVAALQLIISERKDW